MSAEGASRVIDAAKLSGKRTEREKTGGTCIPYPELLRKYGNFLFF
jgi:hypothetical protein